jgi:rhomboid protease GluP
MKLYIRFNLNFLTFLIGLNAFIFFLVVLAETVFGVEAFYVEDITLFGGVVYENESINNIGTLVTSTFLHINLLHFFVNMYSLFRIGQIIDSFFDGRKLFITYILSGLSGSVLTVLFYFLIDENISTIGASGAIFGLIGLLIGGTLKRYRYGFQLPFSFWDVFSVALLALSVGLIPGARINNIAHLGGLFAGIVLGLFFKHSLGVYETGLEKNIVKVLLWFSGFLLVGSYAILFAGNFLL